jgi:threonine dehydratase
LGGAPIFGESVIVTLEEIRVAHARLRGVTVRTPVLEVPEIISDPEDTRRLFLKLENLQPIGAFKLRGAYNKIASLSADERKRGVIAYSSGNHAQGVAYAARALETGRHRHAETLRDPTERDQGYREPRS